ncbi:MAG: hypothetical protein RIT22_2193 [Bacteroidota bacterium]
MHQLYETEWKQKGVVVFAINNNTNEMVKWKEFIEKEKLSDWTNVYPTPVVTIYWTKTKKSLLKKLEQKTTLKL